MRYKLSDIARICKADMSGCDVEINGVSTDSRHSFGSGESPLFVAMIGTVHDGHDYIGELYRRGVRGFMVEREVDCSAYPDAGFVRVGRSLRALQALAANYRGRFAGLVVAVTGSEGKTAVKEWIADAAPEGVKVFRSPRSYNSQIGVALSLLMIAGDEDVAVIEAGISRPGEMRHLSAMIRPDVGVFTSLDERHGENFGSMEQKAAEKAELFAGCRCVVYDSRYPIVADALKGIEKLDSRGFERAVSEFVDEAHTRAAAQVLALYQAAGYDIETVRSNLGRLHDVDLQLGMREGLGGSVIVSDNRNADINSLAIALDYLSGVADGRRKIVIISDILYSSLDDKKLYSIVASRMADAGIDKVVGIGPHISSHAALFKSKAEFYPSVDDYILSFRQNDIENCAVLVKGGQMSGFERIVHLLQRKSHTTVLEINLDAMIHNLNRYRSMMPRGCKLMAMVKASAYGNGDYEIANMLAREGVDYLAVAFADEGVSLRHKGIDLPIVVLNADADSFELMVDERLEPEIYDFESLHDFIDAVRRSGKSRYPIHIKIDSGMHRLGFREGEIDELNRQLAANDRTVVVRSIFSHLATSDMPEQREFTLAQIALFDRLSGRIMASLPYEPLRHINNSAAIEHFPDSDYRMCRLGIGLYGIGTDGLRQISRLKTRVVQVKEIDADQTVGYARAGRLDRRTRVATIPIGYADGLNRHLGCGHWSVVVGGRKAPILGRICMDSCMIDVTGIDVKVGDEVVIFGGGEGNSVEDMARVLDTIPYEVMTSVSQRVKRIYVKG